MMGERQVVDRSAQFGPTIRDPENFQGLADQFLNERNQMASQFGQAMGNIENADPEAHLRMFTNNWADPISNLVSGPYSQFYQANQAIARQTAEDNINTLGSQFANKGALNSSAALRAMGEGSARPFAQAALQNQLGMMNMTGNLWNQTLNNLNQQTLADRQARQNIAQLYANQMNQLGNQAANIKGQSFTISQPMLETLPNTWDKIMGGLGDVVNVGSGITGIITGLDTLGKVGNPATQRPQQMGPYGMY